MMDWYEVFTTAKKVTDNIAYFVPRNNNVDQLASLAGQGERVEVEQNLLNWKMKTLTDCLKPVNFSTTSYEIYIRFFPIYYSLFGPRN